MPNLLRLQEKPSNWIGYWFGVLVCFGVWTNPVHARNLEYVSQSLINVTARLTPHFVITTASNISWKEYNLGHDDIEIFSTDLRPTRFLIYDTDKGDPFCTDYLTYDVGWFGQNNPVHECTSSLTRSNCLYLWHNEDSYYVSWFENVHTLVCVGIKYSHGDLSSRKNEDWNVWHKVYLRGFPNQLNYGVVIKGGEYHLMSPLTLEFGLVYDLNRNEFFGYSTNITHAIILEHSRLLISKSHSLPIRAKNIPYFRNGEIIKPPPCNNKIVGLPYDEEDFESEPVLDADWTCDAHDVVGVIPGMANDLTVMLWCREFQCIITTSFNSLVTTELNRKFVDDEHENIAYRILLILKSLTIKLTNILVTSINLKTFSLTVWSLFSAGLVFRLTHSTIAAAIVACYVAVILLD